MTYAPEHGKELAPLISLTPIEHISSSMYSDKSKIYKVPPKSWSCREIYAACSLASLLCWEIRFARGRGETPGGRKRQKGSFMGGSARPMGQIGTGSEAGL